MNANRKAFLKMISVSEGTSRYPHDGYKTIVGGAQFRDYDYHPHVRVFLPKLNIYSTAAGRYQLLYRYWLAYCKSLKLTGFTPDVQDAIALQQIRECKALDDIDNGRFDVAVKKCSRIWASLPFATYGQHTNSLDDLRIAYVRAGGVIA